MTRRTWAFVVTLVALGAVSVVVVSTYRGRRLEARAEPAPAATIKDLMDSIVDPSADVVWNAVVTTVGPDGTVEKAPHTNEEWAELRRGAIRLVESSNLLLMPGRHVAGPGEKSETPGIELEPAEMEALLNKDRGAWDARVDAFRAVSLDVLSAIDAKDATRLFDVGDKLDTACENCHKQYWYPNEKIPEFPSDVDAK